jgi:hypothetical protein
MRALMIAGLLATLVGSAQAAPASPPASLPEAVLRVVDRVCRPAVDAETSPDNFAAAANLTAEPQAPPHLPMGIAGLTNWRAPSPEGRLYVMSGVFPESTLPSSCVIAVYDAPGAPVSKAMDDYVMGLKRGFENNPRYNFNANGYRFTRYDRRAGDTLHSVVIMEALAPKPGYPSEIFAAFVVDQGWMLHPGKAKP